MKRIAICQSNYIPWKGYFDMIAAVDEFILYDDMQYTRRDWRNRNYIKTPQGLHFLTVPVKVKGKYFQPIRYTEINGDEWSAVHWRSLEHNYKKAPHYHEVAHVFYSLFNERKYHYLSELNRVMIEAVCAYLGIRTKISYSWDYRLAEGRTSKLVDLCLQAGGDEYVSGPAARDYIEEDLFERAHVKLTWFDYNGYPAYKQLWGDFVHNVSVLDLLFNCGPEAPKYMRYVKV